MLITNQFAEKIYYHVISSAGGSIDEYGSIQPGETAEIGAGDGYCYEVRVGIDDLERRIEGSLFSGVYPSDANLTMTLKGINNTNLERQPNFILFMTDQQRSIQHFGLEFVPNHLYNYQWFLDNGVIFENNRINTSPCGPSRASLFSGLFPATNNVTGNQETLNSELMNFSKLLHKAGYEITYKGKFHMDEDFTQFAKSWAQNQNAPVIAAQEDQAILTDYKLNGWTSPDFGTDLVTKNVNDDTIGTLAGGYGNNDDRVVTGNGFIAPGQESVLEFIDRLSGLENPSAKPFCLVISLLNPHDVSLYPFGYDTAGYKYEDFANIREIDLPGTYSSDDLSTKPQVQSAFVNQFNNYGGAKLPPDKALDYARFYAYLHIKSDDLLQQVMDRWNEKASDSVKHNTFLIRMADHGEMGMAHGGMQEKTFNMYNETVKVPMIWYRPDLPKGIRTNNVSLIDFVPTVLDLAGAYLPDASPPLQGTSYADALFGDVPEITSSTLYNYQGTTTPTTPDGPYAGFVPPNSDWSFFPNPLLPLGGNNADYPNNIYGITNRSGYKYGVYFMYAGGVIDWNTAQFEMYKSDDWEEGTNLLPPGGTPDPGFLKLWKQMHSELSNLMTEKNIPMPPGWNSGGLN